MWRKKPEREIKLLDTDIWECTECTGWMRVDMMIDGDDPECPLCQAEMKSATKELPELQLNWSARY